MSVRNHGERAPAPSGRAPNAFEQGKPGTNARADAEAGIEALRQRGGIFVEAVRATRMAMALTDPTLPGNPIVFANQSFLDLSGYGMEEVLGQQPYFMNGPDTDPEDAERFRRILESDEDGVVETVQYAKDGRRFVATVLLSAFNDDAGRTLHHFLSWADVTRRVEAESDAADLRMTQAALRESEERFRTLAESIEDVFYTTDLEGWRISYLSPSYERVWGRPAEELLADPSRFFDTLHPDDRPRFEAGLAAQARGESVTVEYRVLRPDGEARWILDRSFPVAGDGGARRAAGVASDITARKAAEARLADSEERLRLIVENARDYAILLSDENDIVTDWLPGAEAVFGWRPEEIVGKPVALLFTSEDRAAGAPRWETETAAKEGSAPDVRWHLRKDGGRVFLDGQTVALRCADGSLRGFLKIGQDVTERRAEGERLARSEALFRTLATGIEQLVFLSRSDGFRTWGSPQWVEFTGLSFEASLGLGWLGMAHPDDRGATLDGWTEAQASGAYYAEHRVRRAKDGEWRWHQTRARPIDPQAARNSEWVGASTDVHDLRRLQESQAVLVAELQHRTRNIVTVVRSLADRTAAGSASLEDFQARFRSRLAALGRVQGLLSKLGEGQRVDFGALVRAELDAHGALDGEAGKVALEGPENVRLRSAHVQTLALALHELATNAVKHGALAWPQARLDVRWRVERNGKERALAVEWRESGVPLPPGFAPARKGYGSELIERALPYQLKAETRYEIGADGVRCAIRLPLSEPAGGEAESRED